jgi:hypothetical protein
VFLLILLPLAVALIATVLGRAARDDGARWADRRLLILAAVMVIVAGSLAILGIDPEVTRGDAVAGVIVSAAFLGAVPVTAFYTVGYFCRPWFVLVPVLAALAVGTFFYLFFGLFLVADLVYCPPDAHECPL